MKTAFLATALLITAPAVAQLAPQPPDPISFFGPGKLATFGSIGAKLLISCKGTARTDLELTLPDGRRDYYSFLDNEAPIIDSIAPPGMKFDDKKALIENLMANLGRRQLEDFSPANLCKGEEPNRAAAIAILRHVATNVREFDL